MYELSVPLAAELESTNPAMRDATLALSGVLPGGLDLTAYRAANCPIALEGGSKFDGRILWAKGRVRRKNLEILIKLRFGEGKLEDKLFRQCVAGRPPRFVGKIVPGANELVGLAVADA